MQHSTLCAHRWCVACYCLLYMVRYVLHVTCDWAVLILSSVGMGLLLDSCSCVKQTASLLLSALLVILVCWPFWHKEGVMYKLMLLKFICSRLSLYHLNGCCPFVCCQHEIHHMSCVAAVKNLNLHCCLCPSHSTPLALSFSSPEPGQGPELRLGWA